MRPITLIVLIILIFTISLQAQTTNQEQLEEVIELGQLKLLSKGIITPIGEKNTPVITEYFSANPDLLFFSGTPECGNTSVIYQEGDYNQTSFQQTGNRNNFGLLQKGDSNQYDGTINGDENFIRVLQLGNGNHVLQDLKGNGMQLDVIQEGNNHEVIQIEKDGTSPDYQIHQQGEHGMQITIEHIPF
jgi:hypothetical protein